eukprot:scpid34899/ scgid21128/ 
MPCIMGYCIRPASPTVSSCHMPCRFYNERAQSKLNYLWACSLPARARSPCAAAPDSDLEWQRLQTSTSWQNAYRVVPTLQQASQLGDVSTEWVVLKVVSGTCKIYNCRDLMPRVVERSSSE